MLGWILVVLGVLSYAGGLASFIKERFFTETTRSMLPGFTSTDLKTIAELLDKVATLLEKFSKLSVHVQWAVLGLLTIGVGAYLIAAKPF
jgi:uncharacterized membrane protein